MTEQLKDFKLRLDSWTEEGRKLIADMKAADDGSIEMNDMQDIIINGLGISYPASQDRGSLDSASSISLDISGAAISTCNGAGGGSGGVWSGGGGGGVVGGAGYSIDSGPFVPISKDGSLSPKGYFEKQGYEVIQDNAGNGDTFDENMNVVASRRLE